MMIYKLIKSLFWYLEYWDGERPTTKDDIILQYNSDTNIHVNINNSLRRDLSQPIQNFNKMNTGDINFILIIIIPFFMYCLIFFKYSSRTLKSFKIKV